MASHGFAAPSCEHCAIFLVDRNKLHNIHLIYKSSIVKSKLIILISINTRFSSNTEEHYKERYLNVRGLLYSNTWCKPLKVTDAVA